MKKWFKIAAWNIGVIVVLLVIIEFGLRFTRFEMVRNPAANNPSNYYVSDATFGVRIKPNFPLSWFEFRGPGHKVFSNELGCFDKPVRLRKGEPYILAIGDSFTWGYNPLEAKWTSIIERRTGIRVLKCGVVGTGTNYQLRHLKHLLANLPHPPQSVVHLYDTTDFNDDFIFPGETVVDGQRIEDYARIRLSDGEHVERDANPDQNRPGQIYGSRTSRQPRPLVLRSLLNMVFIVDSQVEKRRLVLEGQNPDYLHWRYEFNLLLLDPEKYPYVSKRLDAHIDTLKQMRRAVQNVGASYFLFHTNSFRLPNDRPLVSQLENFFESMPEFKGRMPELGRHLFDPHWNADSEKQVAEFMLERMKVRALASDNLGNSSRQVQRR